jgi:hypothetical protein
VGIDVNQCSSLKQKFIILFLFLVILVCGDKGLGLEEGKEEIGAKSKDIEGVSYSR